MCSNGSTEISDDTDPNDCTSNSLASIIGTGKCVNLVLDFTRKNR